MKSRMKKIVSIRFLPAFMLATTLLFLLGTAVVAEPAMDPVSGTGSSQLDVENAPPEGVMMQFRGSVELSVRGDLSHRQARQEIILCDIHLLFGEQAAVPQAVYIHAVGQSFRQGPHSAGDGRLAHAQKPGYLSKAVAVLQVHCHQHLVFDVEQDQPASQQIDFVATLLSGLQVFVGYIRMNFFHH